MSRRARARGFTLIELLATVVIIGVIVAGVSLAIGEPGQQKIREETERLASLITLAREEAILQSRNLGLGFWQEGYRFYEMADMVDENGQPLWLQLDDDLLHERTLPEEMKIQLTLEGREIVMEATPKKKPQIFILSSGEMSPFSLTLTYKERFKSGFTADALGKLELDGVTLKDTPG